jgi:hypothetical protein
MTTVTISGTIADAYKLSAPVTELSITSTGYIKGGATYGVFSPGMGANYTIVSDGKIKGATYGVELIGGVLTNGSATNTAATITGGLDGVYGFMAVGSSVGATIANYGTILSTAPTSYQNAGVTFFGAEGVFGGPASSLINGSLTDTTAKIEGANGIRFIEAGPVTNFATVIGTGTATQEGYGVRGDSVVNGAPSDTAAYIYGHNVGVAGFATNYGTIKSHGTGVVDGGVNGVSTGSSALIEGATGVLLPTSYNTFSNFGSVIGTKGDGVKAEGGSVYNGGAADTSALIEGATGAYLAGGFVVNLGTVIGQQASSGTTTNAGAVGFGIVVNGSSASSTALIEGIGVGVQLRGLVVNFGTIEATAPGGYAVKLTGTNSRLRVEAGSKLIGKVNGGGFTLEFASGTAGTISSLSGGSIVAGGVDYENFGTLNIFVGAAFTTTGMGTIASGGVATLGVTGTLDVAGTLIVTGSLVTTGIVNDVLVTNGFIDGAGHLDIEGGVSNFGAGTRLTTTHVLISGASTLVDMTSLTYAGAWDQTAGTVNVSGGDVFKLTGAGDRLSGTLAGGGEVILSGSGDHLSDLTSTVTRTAIDAASVTLSGAIDVAGVLAISSPDATLSGITQFTGGGGIHLAHPATSEIIGATSSSLLENSDKIQGGGQLGGGRLRLTNEAAGTILSFGAVAMVINTGTSVIGNAGLIEALSGGGMAIDGAVANTGVLEARGGDLTVAGAVTGAGEVIIRGGAASFASTFGENVAFVTKGELALAQSQAYAGTISGFSKTGATSLDLEDISFAGATAGYSGTKTSGTLTVTDGTHTAKIKFAGNYTASTWTLSSDGHGGVLVVDPAAAGSSAHVMSSAMAAFAPTPAASGASGGQARGADAPLLAAPSG